MKITFPHMGNAYIAIRVLLDELNLPYFMPPLKNRKTMELGALNSPEFMCLPFKTVLGDFMQGLNNGADVILFGGGCGQCRLSYYGDLQQEILKDLGYKFTYIHLNLSHITYREMRQKLGPLTEGKGAAAVAKALYKGVRTVFMADSLYRAAAYLRCREVKKGTADSLMRAFEKEILAASGYREAKRTIQKTRRAIKEAPLDPGARPLKIALVGEIFIASDPFTSLEIEEKLGNLGAEVVNFMGVGMWIRHHFLSWFCPVKRREKALRAAREFFNTYDVGGHGVHTVGNTVLSAKGGFDGVIQIYPFTCMPEIIAQCALCDIGEKYKAPVMTLIVDEMTGEAGFVTRLEAFTDMLRARREKGEALKFLKNKNNVKKIIYKPPLGY